jgi:phospholipid/cholesterol/gamma-HCH transport system ATP-binding protein
MRRVPTDPGTERYVAPQKYEEWPIDRLEAGVPLAPVPKGKEVYASVRGLRKSFGVRRILRGIDCDIYRGETFVILGGSGSGKTTLLKHLMGMLKPDYGTIEVGGIDLARATEEDIAAYRRRMGVVFQNAALLNSLTVLENVGLPLVEVDHCPEDEVRERVIAALRRVFLPADEILDLKPANLSGGMRKRVGIARAIIQDPELIFYDEPTTGLDPVTVNGVNELTLDLQHNMGVTSVVITHDLDAAFMIADRIAVLYKGRLVAIGDQEHIEANPHPVLRQLLSGSTRGPLTEGYVEDDGRPRPTPKGQRKRETDRVTDEIDPYPATPSDDTPGTEPTHGES